MIVRDKMIKYYEQFYMHIIKFTLICKLCRNDYDILELESRIKNLSTILQW